MAVDLANYQTDTFTLKIDHAGRIIVKLLPGTIAMQQAAKEYYAYIDKILPKLKLSRPRPVCIDISDCRSISSDASQYAASQVRYHSALAVINDYPKGLKVANTLLATRELDYPAQVFITLEQGLSFITTAHNKRYPKQKIPNA